MADVDQAVAGEVVEEREEVALAPARLDLVLLEEGVPDLHHAPGCLEELPDPRSHGIEAEVGSPAQVEDRRLALHVAGNLVPDGGDDR